MKIIVLTPVKNEAWILNRFLSVTSQFADHIIILDQNSTDGSLEICQSFPKVILIKNDSEKYDEASRQLLLIKTARELEQGPKILMALDADEILAADAMQTQGWKTMLNTKPGTLLCFEKPELYLVPEKTIRYLNTWPLAFVDDGSEHKPSLIHSIRVPVSESGAVLHLHDIKILHYAMLRMPAQSAKWRMYSVIENINGTKSLRQRRRTYTSSKNWIESGKLENAPQTWFDVWEKKNIDMKNIQDIKYYWQDLYVLQAFEKYGAKRFWNDDIWNANWQEALLYFRNTGFSDLPNQILYPPRLRTVMLNIFDNLMSKVYYFLSK